jgi:hypothetical protein
VLRRSDRGKFVLQRARAGVALGCLIEAVDLIEVENRYSIKVALKNAEHLVRRSVDLTIEFQTYERIGTKAARFFEKAEIPLIAVEIPHPNAVFLGVNIRFFSSLEISHIVKWLRLAQTPRDRAIGLYSPAAFHLWSCPGNEKADRKVWNEERRRDGMPCFGQILDSRSVLCASVVNGRGMACL